MDGSMNKRCLLLLLKILLIIKTMQKVQSAQILPAKHRDIQVSRVVSIKVSQLVVGG
jgi:hypothetical protein